MKLANLFTTSEGFGRDYALPGSDTPFGGPVDADVRLAEPRDLFWPEQVVKADDHDVRPFTPYDAVMLPQLGEGFDDPYVFKAVFVVGAGGSGKSSIAREMFAGRGLKVIDQDRHLERFLRDEEIEWDEKFGPSLKDFKRAQQLAYKEREQYSKRRLGLVVDATGWEYRRIAEPVRDLRKLGYDCVMVFVTTSLDTAFDRNDKRAAAGGRKVPDSAITRTWAGVHDNLSSYRSLFGAKNMVVVKNDEDIDQQRWQADIAPYLYNLGSKLIDRPISNPIGRAWVQKRAQAWKLETENRPTIVVPAGLFDSEEVDTVSVDEGVAQMFHGRKVDSRSFDLKFVGDGADQEGPGFYFTSDSLDARRYAFPSGVVLTCVLRLKKELPRVGRVRRAEIVRLIEAAPDLADTLTDWAEDPAVAKSIAISGMVGRDPFDAFTQVWADFYRKDSAEYLRQVVKLGYDHGSMDRSGGVRHVVVFDPAAIRVLSSTPFEPES